MLKKYTRGKYITHLNKIESPILEGKVRKINADDYRFDWYELYYKYSKDSVNLNLFIFAAWLINEERDTYFKSSMNFYPWKVTRIKSEDGLISDYPHYYSIHWDDVNHPKIFAIRKSVNSEFILSRSMKDFLKYTPSYLGVLTANFWGTGFDLFDYGIDIKIEEGLIPHGFVNKPK